ncbi:acetyl-CoA C-acetyltransferase [Jatrophihabitans endophyticus]|uniref:Acetyl-CoA C-acetyltransferase n=1 Tax=Jatrophihabitans endophyticus TaxID=1206085 RepID=A0A1M5D3E3_9ACTN|nr:acetyl-CoA C-acetyltransferase [Jatrophihabitans endophyticus]SHF61370.1 acetyl-CoA C-acetyltransferase [Jatrophihabitans endophyticus]
MTEAFVYDAVRTPRGRGKDTGSLHGTKPVSLVVGLLDEVRKRNPELDPAAVEDVILGCVSPVGEQGADIARTAALAAGYETSGPGFQLNRFCASGLEAVNVAAQKVRSGWEDLILAGGVEAMSRVPMGSDGGAWAQDPETAYDTSFVPQGISADLIATTEGFSRTDVDTYAAESQDRAAKAIANGNFAKSIVPVVDLNGKIVLDHDEFPRAGTTVESLAGLKPSFKALAEMGGFDAVALQKYHWVEKIDHVHTPGNSSGIVDGASIVVIGNEQAGQANGLRPRARIVSVGVVGSEPTIMLTGPTPSAQKALAKAGLTADDIDLWELNEAFAAVVLKFMKDLKVPHEKINVNGGAIALGHPLGATGAMILGTLVDELEARDLRYGLATLCVGGGMGVATIVERVS